MTKLSHRAELKKARGQSVVEIAIMLPFFLLLIAGVVELSNLLLVQNRITAAARLAARFGSTGGQAEGMQIVTINAITQTLPTDENIWDIWIIRGVVNDQGTGINTLPECNNSIVCEHVYGNGATEDFGDIDFYLKSQEAYDQILADLQTWSEFDGNRDVITVTDGTNPSTPGDARLNIANTQFVGIMVAHDVQSILGLNQVLENDIFTIREMVVMEQFTLTGNQNNGCTAFPIMVNGSSVRNLDTTKPANETSFPDAGEFVYPTSGVPTPGDFPPYVSEHFIFAPNAASKAREGDVFMYTFDLSINEARFLSWSGATLESDMAWPGLGSLSYTDFYDAADTTLHIDNYVAVENGNIANALTVLQEHIDNERALRVLAADTVSGQPVQIDGFVVLRPLGYGLNGSNKTWILFEFINYDDSCGQT